HSCSGLCHYWSFSDWPFGTDALSPHALPCLCQAIEHAAFPPNFRGLRVFRCSAYAKWSISQLTVRFAARTHGGGTLHVFMKWTTKRQRHLFRGRPFHYRVRIHRCLGKDPPTPGNHTFRTNHQGQTWTAVSATGLFFQVWGCGSPTASPTATPT